ncbi:hypothetical protein [Streptomyces marispadix]|nr:hypothetical protein [Streptomyces marispadix]
MVVAVAAVALRIRAVGVAVMAITVITANVSFTIREGGRDVG